MRSAIFIALIASALMMLAATPSRAQHDPANPVPWPGGGYQVITDGRPHSWYYRLPVQHPRVNQRREISLRVLSRGAATKVSIVDNATATSRSFCNTSWVLGDSGARPFEQVPLLAPVLVVSTAAGVTQWSVIVEERMAPRPPIVHRPGPASTPTPTPTPVPTPTPTPDGPLPMMGPTEPGAGVWPGTFSGPWSTVNRPMYFYVDHSGGPFTLGVMCTASFSAGVTAYVVDPHATTGLEYPMDGTPTVSSGTVTHNQTATAQQTFNLPRGRYVLRVELDTSGGTFSARVTAH